MRFFLFSSILYRKWLFLIYLVKIFVVAMFGVTR